MSIVGTARSYAHLAPTIALFAGFVFDIFTLNRPDALFENIVISGYLIISALAIVAFQTNFFNTHERARLTLLTVLQFSFGNLASALMVLYARSGTFTGSLIFIGLLGALFLGNELLKDRYARNTLRVSLWYFLLLTYMALVVPILVNEIGVLAFATSIFFALVVMSLFIRILALVAGMPRDEYAQHIRISVITITVIFGTLYAANLIPPVPLALKQIGIYHSIERRGLEYEVTYEKPAWFEFWRDTNSTYHFDASGTAYCMSSVFAPPRLETEIWHRWEKYDQATDSWNTVSRTPFPIRGGRDAGYRGYTQTTQIDSGVWRCNVETKWGALIGRTTFTATPATPQTKIPTDAI
tara:strand:+ start:19370 stop:20431 length:1062 start_codon:yes stop_codon:yes gene_type:complete